MISASDGLAASGDLSEVLDKLRIVAAVDLLTSFWLFLVAIFLRVEFFGLMLHIQLCRFLICFSQRQLLLFFDLLFLEPFLGHRFFDAQVAALELGTR